MPVAPPHERLRELANEAVGAARTAKKHRKRLEGANYYAEKLARLRTDATVAIRELAGGGRDTSSFRPLVEACFSANIDQKDRLAAKRALEHELTTNWARRSPAAVPGEEDAIFPLEMLRRRPYLVTIGRQANGCFVNGWYDACGVMMRRLLEIAIIEAFEHKGLAAKIRTGQDEYVQLTDLAKAALQEFRSLSRNTKPVLLDLVRAGHRTAHGRLYTYRKYIEEVRQGYRDAVQDFLRLADLL